MATSLGLLALMAFDQAPGVALTPPPQWPESTHLARPANRAVMLVFVHPSCSCTGATIAELAKLPSTTDIVFVLAHAARFRNLWMNNASALPGATIVWDERGLEAGRFGAGTSGYVLLYGPRGNLLFHGGVTGSRGHEGDNYGLSGLLASIRAASPDTALPVTRSSPVFGCSLRGTTKWRLGKI